MAKNQAPNGEGKGNEPVPQVDLDDERDLRQRANDVVAEFVVNEAIDSPPAQAPKSPESS